MSIGESRLGSYQGIFQHGESLLARWPHLGDILAFCVFVIAYYFAYRYGMSFSATTASPFWFPDSVLLCALLKTRPTRWWILVAATLPIRIISEISQNMPMWVLLSCFVIDSTRGLLAALALRRFLPNPSRFESLRDFAIFFVIAVVTIPVLDAFGCTAVHFVDGNDFWTSWKQWFLGSALTQLIITPAILYWVFGGLDAIRKLSVARRIEGLLILSGLIVTGYLAGYSSDPSTSLADPRSYAPVAFLFLAAIRFGMLGASTAGALLALLFIGSAIEGVGPFSGHSPAVTASALQGFLFPRSIVLYLVAITIEQSTRANNALRESEARFRNIANSSPVMIWMTAPDQSCEFVSQSWLNFTGHSIESQLGRGWSGSVHPADMKHTFERCYSAFDSRQSFEVEYRLRRYDGEYRWMLSKGMPRFEPNGEFLGYIGMAVDITDRKIVEELHDTMAHTQRLALLGELTAVIAHEVRQPLSAILSNSAALERMLIRANTATGEISEIISDISESIKRADDVMQRVGGFTQKLNVQMSPLDMNTTVKDVLALVSADAWKRSVQIHLKLRSDLSPVFGNRTQLQQVLLNLIVNGMDAMRDTPESARHLMVQTIRNSNNKVEVLVSDYGRGIAPEELPQLFESFFTTKQGGMGLGLAIARSIISLHHGQIWGENNDGGGATFHFTVPTADANAIAAQPD